MHTARAGYAFVENRRRNFSQQGYAVFLCAPDQGERDVFLWSSTRPHMQVRVWPDGLRTISISSFEPPAAPGDYGPPDMRAWDIPQGPMGVPEYVRPPCIVAHLDSCDMLNHPRDFAVIRTATLLMKQPYKWASSMKALKPGTKVQVMETYTMAPELGWAQIEVLPGGVIPPPWHETKSPVRIERVGPVGYVRTDVLQALVKSGAKRGNHPLLH
jgi:hypothetical protein